MGTKISVIINTLNDEKDIENAIKSVGWADEVVVCDMHSEDKTVMLAKRLGARTVLHKRVNFVEPTRNSSISKASNDWILILDPDEEVPAPLATKLQEIAEKGEVDVVEIPRKNIIFGKWMEASMWWPDYNIRFFKKGAVVWSNKIHRPPQTIGLIAKLEMDEKYALLHHHYISVTQFINRMNRYSTIQAEELVKEGYQFRWQDIIRKPFGEFLGRFFANKGFKDCLHGLTLSLLQSFSFLVVYLKVWEIEKFRQENISLENIKNETGKMGKEIHYWFNYSALPKEPLQRFVQKVKNRLL